jgi:hypothetical protein
MKSIRTSDTDRLEYREPVGAGGVFGAILLIGFVGVFILGGRGLLRWPESFPEVLFMGTFAMIVLAVIVRFVFELVRTGTTIDRRSKTVTTRWGFLAPMFSKTRPLTDFDHLQITSGGTLRGLPLYLLVIAGPSRKAVIGSGSDYEAMVGMAEEVGKFLGFDVHGLHKQTSD